MFKLLSLPKTRLFTIPLFFYYLGERALAYIFPIVLEKSLNSNLLVGVVLSLTGPISLALDVLLPNFLTRKAWRKQLLIGLACAITFPIFVFYAQTWQLALLFIFAGTSWSISYEIISFAIANFICEVEEKRNFSRAWGIIYFTTQIVAICGILIGPTLLELPLTQTYFLLAGCQSLGLATAFVVTRIIKNKAKRSPEVLTGAQLPIAIAKKKSWHNFTSEIKYWRTYSSRVSPLILLGFWVGIVDAVFWSYGGLLGESLNIGHYAGVAILLCYSLPGLVSTFLLSKLKIWRGKKRYSQVALLLAGLILTLLVYTAINKLLIFPLLVIFGLLFSFAKPLNDSVYSDLIDRSAADSQEHLIGISKSNDSFSYLIAPIAVGWLIDKTSYLDSFALLGPITILIALFLLWKTPAKLRLPQTKLLEIAA